MTRLPRAATGNPAMRMAISLTTPIPTAIRSERYRVRFDSRRQAQLCAQTAGANRFVWNLFLANNDWRYRVCRKARGYDFPEAQRPLWVDPSRTWQSMYKRFARIRRGTYDREFRASPEGAVYADLDLSWLRDLPSAPVRHALKYLDAAYQVFYKAHAVPAAVPVRWQAAAFSAAQESAGTQSRRLHHPGQGEDGRPPAAHLPVGMGAAGAGRQPSVPGVRAQDRAAAEGGHGPAPEVVRHRCIRGAGRTVATAGR
ncbi:MAG: helix-turn-helix domain-containing protein [Caldilineaceae bacterium]|nr:helix-turn-helix domain-containing protein [Caldilineaceae bacterium]